MSTLHSLSSAFAWLCSLMCPILFVFLFLKRSRQIIFVLCDHIGWIGGLMRLPSFFKKGLTRPAWNKILRQPLVPTRDLSLEDHANLSTLTATSITPNSLSRDANLSWSPLSQRLSIVIPCLAMTNSHTPFLRWLSLGSLDSCFKRRGDSPLPLECHRVALFVDVPRSVFFSFLKRQWWEDDAHWHLAGD